VKDYTDGLCNRGLGLHIAALAISKGSVKGEKTPEQAQAALVALANHFRHCETCRDHPVVKMIREMIEELTR